jgi:hypothetical protein
MCSVHGDHVFRNYVISNVCVELLSVSQNLCVSLSSFSCHVQLSFFMGYVLVLVSNMRLVNT